MCIPSGGWASGGCTDEVSMKHINCKLRRTLVNTYTSVLTALSGLGDRLFRLGIMCFFVFDIWYHKQESIVITDHTGLHPFQEARLVQLRPDMQPQCHTRSAS